MSTQSETSDERSGWPTGWLLWTGTFGSGTQAGRSLRNHTALGLLLVVLGPGLGFIPSPPARLMGALLVPVGVGVIVWAYVRYLAELDELHRMLLLESLAFSYGVVMALGAVWFGLYTVGFEFAQAATVGWIFWTILLAEALRGPVLVVLTRRRG